MLEPPRPGRHPKRPRDPFQLAKLIGDIATGQAKDEAPAPPAPESPAATFGRQGGLKGGKARAKALSPAKRKAIARKAARARWGAK